MAYFRIPQFRLKVLKLITDESNSEDWKAAEYNIEDEKPNVDSNTDTFSLLFNWEKNFYPLIEKAEKYRDNRCHLEEILR